MLFRILLLLYRIFIGKSILFEKKDVFFQKIGDQKVPTSRVTMSEATERAQTRSAPI